MSTKSLSVVPAVTERPEWVRWDEPAFTSQEHQELYRELVEKMERESNLNPATSTIVGLAIRTVAREYVVRLAGDQGETKARQLERDRRMLAMLKTITESAQRASGGRAEFERLVLGLVPVIMGAIDSRVGHEPVLAAKLKEDIGAELGAYLRRELPGG